MALFLFCVSDGIEQGRPVVADEASKTRSTGSRNRSQCALLRYSDQQYIVDMSVQEKRKETKLQHML
jgi:hypothetical protein